MSDDARRALTEEERARIHAARRDGGICGLCRRAFVDGEAIWMERLAVHGQRGRMTHWRVPVGAECVAPETVRATCKAEPEHCAGCGRGVYYQAADRRRRSAYCSRRCAATRAAAVRSTGRTPAARRSGAHDVRATDVPPWER